jgi:hypothetical protein
MENRWTMIGRVMVLEAQALKARWGCEMPPQDALPNQALERQVDHWCRRLADNLTEPIDPPVPVRPWVLARLMCASASLSGRDRAGIPFHGLSKDGICDLLTTEWHAESRDCWAALVMEDLDA